ncbi:uncharacterized protein LOC112562588 isoform X2 [Pomacea canaliculata]|uniref:uncharacterized protein LOC112562588 isoform X2 n=1 Tax=Pomacea canaliculata TaxID=400727 RepID=UPI000D73DA56|nr:uncharacterized protein LOC112562588 isoform X2 [Pomacea canaliculata]
MVRVDELIEAITYNFPTKGKRKQRGGSDCALCAQSGRRGKGKKNCHYVFLAGAKNSSRLSPFSHNPKILDNDDDGDVDHKYDDDDMTVLGGMFETAIVRQFDDDDPRLFKLPPVFNGQDPTQYKGGRILPLISENTYLTTNRRAIHKMGDQREETTEGVRFPPLSSQQMTKDDKGRLADPRRLGSERKDKREQLLQHDLNDRSGSALDHADLGNSRGREGQFLVSRESTDSPPQRMIVSIKIKSGEVLQISSMDNLVDFDDAKENQLDREKMKKQRKGRRGIQSPSSFSGLTTFSTEAALYEADSPDQTFLSRVRSASWCQCSDHAMVSAHCPECRKTSGNHEKWCMSRNSLCASCGKPFKRKYPHLERKSPSSTTLTIDSFTSTADVETTPARNSMRVTDDGNMVSSDWHDSGFEDSGEARNRPSKRKTTSHVRVSKSKEREEKLNSLTSTSIDADVHRRAYDLAVSYAHTKRFMQQHKSFSVSDIAPTGVCFSYFPLLKTKRPRASENEGEADIFPHFFGVRADEREGKKVKVKKGLKHVLGNTNLEDFYPGGKNYPKS